MSNMVDTPAVADLRERARRHAVPGYGAMSEDELRAALSGEPMPAAAAGDAGDDAGSPGSAAEDTRDLEDLTVVELRERARALNIPGARNMNKAELVDALVRADPADPAALSDEDGEPDDEDGEPDDADETAETE